MNLKQRFALIFSLIFSIMLGSVLFILYTMFSNYRRDELKEVLTETGESTLDLVLEIRNAGHEFSKSFDDRSIIKLYNEKVLIFNDSLKLIYSDLKDETVNWSKDDLDRIRSGDFFDQDKNNTDMVGLKRTYANSDYYILVSALDNYGMNKVTYLKYLLIAAFITSSLSVWMLSFYLSKKSLEPLDEVTKNIRDISDKNLNTRLPESGKNDEVSTLAHSFNLMLERIDKSFKYQKEFVGNASHELRTPVARISLQIENLISDMDISASLRKSLKSINEDTHQLSDIVTSLLVLSKLESQSYKMPESKIRIDEIIFSCAEKFRIIAPEFKIHFEIINESINEPDVEVMGDESLLKIAFNNLLKNAYTYSDNKEVNILVKQKDETIDIIIINSGTAPDIPDTRELFNAFTRGSNALQNQGFGLGLGIVQRILQYHKADIIYLRPDSNTNKIIISFVQKT